MIISQLITLKLIFRSLSSFTCHLWHSYCVFVQEHIEGTYNPAQLVKASDMVASLVYNRNKHLSGQVLVAWWPSLCRSLYLRINTILPSLFWKPLISATMIYFCGQTWRQGGRRYFCGDREVEATYVYTFLELLYFAHILSH